MVEVAKDRSVSKCRAPQKVGAGREHARSCADLVEKALKNLIADERTLYPEDLVLA